MNIQTKYLGELDIDEGKILIFPNGILGFENSKEFVLLDLPENPYFKFLQDVKNSYVSFLLINPWDFFKSYDVNLADEELKKIGIFEKEENNMAIFSVVTLGSSFKDSTGNLLAPIVINLSERRGRQLVLNDSVYTTRHKLFPEGQAK